MISHASAIAFSWMTPPSRDTPAMVAILIANRYDGTIKQRKPSREAHWRGDIMPNNVTTIINADPIVIDSLAGENGPVDFNTVIPMPSTVFRGGLTVEASRDYPGELNWYGWSREHWGTKWNAYQAKRLRGDAVSFLSAWNFPDPVLAALSSKFPDKEIRVAYADEDFGSNLGMVTYRGGIGTRNETIDNAPWGARATFATMLTDGIGAESYYDGDSRQKLIDETASFTLEHPDFDFDDIASMGENESNED